MKNNNWQEVEYLLTQVYGEKKATSLIFQLKKLSSKYQSKASDVSLSQKDIALVTYANSIEDKKGKQKPLEALNEFLQRYKINKVINIVHLLPFYPWDTDRGFSVCDYYKVDPHHGDWQDLSKLSKQARLMFDFVANHASINNPIIQAALIERHLAKSNQNYKKFKKYKDFVIAYSDKDKPTEKQLKLLARPRPTPVLTRYIVFQKDGKLTAVLGEVTKKKGIKIIGSGWVWTTFSRPVNKDGSQATRQVDLNFQNPLVFLETIKIILFYSSQGASLIRLDAIGYIWKKLGSVSLHERQCHLILAAINKALKITLPELTTIAEVNEPQDKVFTYLGSSQYPESDLVYQFTHFPLAIHAVLTKNASFYCQWLKTTKPFKGKQFVTITGSHDGLGLKPARGILPDKEIKKLENILIKKHKGLPNYASLPGGQKIVYEICATPWNLINNPHSSEPFALKLKRYLAVIALGLIVRGMPAFYINGLLGSKNYLPKKGLDENRTINREIFSASLLFKQLDKNSGLGKVLSSLKVLLSIRSRQPAFSPTAPPLKVLDLKKKKFLAVWLPAKKRTKSILNIANLSSKKEKIVFSNSLLKGNSWFDLISRRKVVLKQNRFSLTLNPYQVLWLKAQLG